jgi:hypothetical protein
MRFMLRSLVLTSAAFCATAAFAASKVVVTVPFNFETHGQAFPAGQYAVSLDRNANVLTLSNMTNTSQSINWVVSPADNASTPTLQMKFDDAGYTRELHSIQLGTRITPVLDAPAKHHDAGSSVVAAGGQ